MIEQLQRAPQIERFLENRAKAESGAVEPVVLEKDKFPVELLALAEQLQEITKTWNPVEFVTASSESIKREKAKVFESYKTGEEYNPAFEYPGVDNASIDVEAAEKQIREIRQQVLAFQPTNEAERLAKIAFHYKVQDDLASIGLIKGLRQKDETMIKDAMNIKYPRTDRSLMAAVEAEYEEFIEETAHPTKITDAPILNPEQQKLLKDSKIDAQGIKEAFEWVLKEYGILKSDETPQGFEVIVDPEATGIDVRDKSSKPLTIFIPADREMSGQKLLEMLGHEIESHARQSMNGLSLAIGGGALKVDDETLYEGLARQRDQEFNETYFGEKDTSPTMLYVMAMKQAENGDSFAQIFKEMVDKRLHLYLGINKDQELNYESEEVQKKLPDALNEAWKYTYRVMRGHTDTSNKEKYSFGKDAAYTRGLHVQEQLSQAGYSFVNEAAIMQLNALPLLGRVKLEEQDLPHPFQDIRKRYCFEVLLPKLEEHNKQ